MSEDRLIETREIKDELIRQKEKVSNVIEIVQASIGKGAEMIGELNKYQSKQAYLRDMYDNVPEIEVINMSDEKYATFKIPLESMVSSGEAVLLINEQVHASKKQWYGHYNVCASLSTIASSAATSAACFCDTEKTWFPNGKNITQAYKIIDETNDHIEIIKSELITGFSDIANDFDAFLKKFRSFPTGKTQYQDLIGLRSTFFFKMIFEFAGQHYGSGMNRKQMIEKFVFGTAPVITSAESLIRECLNIYRELSDQDRSGNSVKLGKVSSTYIETMFRRLVANIAAILQLRSGNFKP